MKILIDVGGSGVKIKRYSQGILQPDTQKFKPKTFDEFCDVISQVADGSAVEGVAISLAGEYDYTDELVISCYFYPFLCGPLRDRLVRKFKCKNVHIVNDGDAHAIALKEDYAQMEMAWRGAVNLSLGTSVGFGLLDWEGNLIHTCRGHNWEVCKWQCATREDTKELYYVLGSKGLKSLEDKHGTPNAYIYYGQRLCNFFARNLVPVFHPQIIGLSGGIIADHKEDIEDGVRRECEMRHYCEAGGVLDFVDIHFSSDRDFVMKGLIELLDISLIGELEDFAFRCRNKIKEKFCFKSDQN